MMWVEENACVIHSRELEVTGDHICGYHVFGEPIPEWMDHPGMQPVDPANSGLELVEGGTHCGNCKYYAEGKCAAVVGEDGVPADVAEYGCCARWETA